MQIRGFSEQVKSGLDNLDFKGKQDLLRLLVERVNYDGQKIEIQTVLTINDKLNTIHRRGPRGWGRYSRVLSVAI